MAAAKVRDAITDRPVAPSPGSSPDGMTPAGPQPTARMVRAVAAVAGVGVGAVLALVAAARRGKAVHPHGDVYAARLVVAGVPAAPAAAQLLATAGEHAALVRFSRSLGLPRPLPDLLGMSIRVLDAYGRGRHQDFLLVSSTDRPVLHHLFVPATDVQQRPYSSSLPYRAGAQRFIVGALPHADSPRPAGETELERVRIAAATGRLRFQLAVAAPMTRFTPVAELHVGAPLPTAADALRFLPLNAGGGLEPLGLLNEMRRYAYPMSQWAWGQTRRDGAQTQREAERFSGTRAPSSSHHSPSAP
jgi:hypothetical protein